MWLDLLFGDRSGGTRREFKFCSGLQCKSIHFVPCNKACGKPSWTIDPVTSAWIYGVLDIKGEFTGPKIAYVYPDNVTAYLGHFENGVMIEAKPASVVQRTSFIGLLDVKFRIEDDTTFSLQPSTHNTFGSAPLVEDIYEARMVYPATSGVEGAGEGLFSRHQVPARTLLAFYNGYRIPIDVDYINELYAFDENKKLSMKAYTIKVGDDDQFFLDIPLEAGKNRSIYCGTLGHKVNHSFTPNCKYINAQHPRWGRIVAVESTRQIEKDEELFCNYGYDAAVNTVPMWFKEMYKKHQNGLD